EYLQPYTRAVERINGVPARGGRPAAAGLVDQLKDFLPGGQGRTQLDAVLTLHQTWLRDSATTEIADVRAGHRDAALATVDGGVGKADFDAMRAAVRTLHGNLLQQVA